jgi:hypothetical protein
VLNNNNRYDLSDRLIHFFRSVDLEKSDAPAWPLDMSHASINETTLLQPYFLLRHAIRLGRIYATWSVRSGRRTIHGLRPAVCFTDMPVAAFVEAGRARAAAGQAMSPYGIVFSKGAAFSVGARPVVYGLSTTAYASGGDDDTPRLFDDAVLPLEEQYRYVAYDPTTGKLDWSHEREWRWPLNGQPWTDPDGLPPNSSEDLPGLDLDDPRVAGLGVIVATPTEARGVVYDILTKIDRGDIDLAHYQFVLAHEAISGWEDLRDRGVLEQTITDNLIDLGDYFQQRPAEVEALTQNFEELAAAVLAEGAKPRFGETGGCWLWLLDNMHPMARALVATGAACVNKEGKYLVRPTGWDERYDLRQREEMAGMLACRLSADVGLRANYFSVLGSDDPDAVPYYNGDELDDRLFYNWNEV